VRTYQSSPHTTAFYQLVKGVWTLTGDGTVPDENLEFDANGLLLVPYAIVYAQPATLIGGSAADMASDAWPVTQVTSIGGTRRQADKLRDKIRTGVVGRRLSIDGRSTDPISLLQELGTRRDDTVKPPLFYAIDLFQTFNTTA
jgi:hypothetical protein